MGLIVQKVFLFISIQYREFIGHAISSICPPRVFFLRSVPALSDPSEYFDYLIL